jgi:hypothetical protein
LSAAIQPRARDVNAWKALALLHCLFALEIVLSLRHRIHDFGASILIAQGRYGERKPVQEIIILISVIFASVLAVAALYWSRFASEATWIAAVITIIIFALFAIEAASLHALDAIFYQKLASVMLIGWIWIFASVGIILAAIWHLVGEHNYD